MQYSILLMNAFSMLIDIGDDYLACICTYIIGVDSKC